MSVATGGSLTVAERRPTLTAPEPESRPATTTPVCGTAATGESRHGHLAATKRGWTIVLVSLPQATGRDEAAEQAADAREVACAASACWTRRFASLHPGYYVVFTGIFDTQVEAASALQRARAVVRGAYTREIVP